MNEKPQTLKPLGKLCMTIGQLPTSYVESMSYYEQLIWLTKYLQDNVIPAVNQNATILEELQSYVEHYFDNLDVQEEINNKLDKMVEDGTLEELIGNYIQPRIDLQNQKINELEEIITNVASGSPLVASSTDDMTDTSRIYVNTTDGKWYYYDGDSWEIGGDYQSSGIADGSIGLLMLDDLLQSNFYAKYSSPLSLGNAYTGYYKGDGTFVDSNDFVNYHYSLENGKTYICNGNNNYQCNGLVIKDNSNNVIYHSQNNTSQHQVFSTKFKCTENNLTAYISIQNNITETDVRYQNNMLREITDIYNLLKYSNNPVKIKDIGGFIKASTIGNNDRIEFTLLETSQCSMYQMSKGQSYRINLWDYSNVAGLVVADNTNNIIYASSDSNIGSTYVNSTYEFTASSDGIIYLTKYNEAHPVTINIINDALNFEISPLFGKKMSLNGDSICAGAGYNGGYGKIIGDKYNMIIQNIGEGGATITSHTYYENDSPRHWINVTITDMDEDSDYAIIEGGVNDSSQSITLGTISDGYDAELDADTYIGAFENMLKQLTSRFKGKKYGYIAVHQMTNNYRVTNNESTSYYWAAKKCCEKWGVPFLDLNTQVPPFAYLIGTSLSSLPTTYTKDGDGWHPNEAGYKKYYVDKIISWLESL